MDEVIGYDGPEHYPSTPLHLRAWFGGADDDDATSEPVLLTIPRQGRYATA